MPKRKIIIESQNPLDIEPEELIPWAKNIEEKCPKFGAVVSKEDRQRGYGVTWWEVFNVWLPDGIWFFSGLVAKGIADSFVEWLKTRVVDGKSKKRPKYVAIYDHRGKVVKSVKVSEGVVEDCTREDRKKGTRKPPPTES